MGALLMAPNGQESLRTIFRYISLVADDSRAERLNEQLDTRQPQVKETLMTLPERWMAEGKAEGKAELLGKLLRLKFGELSDAAQRRLAEASEVDVDRWTERVLSAENVDALLFER